MLKGDYGDLMFSGVSTFWNPILKSHMDGRIRHHMDTQD